MIISHKYKFIFVKTKKTAGTSIETYLNRFCNTEDIFTPIGFEKDTKNHSAINYRGFFNPINELQRIKNINQFKKTIIDFITQNKFYNHMPAYLIKARIPNKIWENYYKFCVERNPWDKTISHYFMLKNRIDKDLTFDEYILNKKFCFNHPLYMDYKQKNIIVDHVIKYEKLMPEIAKIFNQLNIPFSDSLGVNAKTNIRKDKRRYQQFFSNEYEKYREVIKKAFKKEINLHEYKFEDDDF